MSDSLTPSTAGHVELLVLLTDRLQATGHLTFAEYMELALYAPGLGYYERSEQRIGGRGADFYTSPHLGADFGEILALQIAELWQKMGRPEQFMVVEMGAGQGLIARDILAYWQRHQPALYELVDYVIIETAAAMIAEQQRLLQGLPVRWTTWKALPDNGVRGCFLSNELIDALPVHQVMVQQGKLQEIYVTQVDGMLQEMVAPLSTPALADYFTALNIDLVSYGEGYRTEVNLAAREWLQQVAKKLQAGYVLSIDYGYSAERYYNPMRNRGTLQCYYQHHYHDDPYIHIGDQDITAHVDFTTVERWGQELGLQSLGLTKQGMFLMAWDWGDRLSTVTQFSSDPMVVIERRVGLQRAIDPTGLGGFWVLLQGKGVEASDLRGWSMAHPISSR
jgi:SAM-dependent MidA family methyltransferase